MMKTFSITPQIDEKRAMINCPCCGGDSFMPHWECGDFSYVMCRDCRLILQNPQPVFESLDKRYDEQYFRYEQQNDRLFFGLMLKGLDDIDFPGNNASAGNRGVFLDIGCATGLLVEHMQKKGWTSRGVELCGPAAEFGSKERNIEIFSGTVEQAAYEDESYDVVHCSHLIEHLNDPSMFLDEVYRILKPGGLFICTTPNADGLQGRLFGERWRSAIADHMVLFSKKTLKKMLRKKSFHTEKVKSWGGLGQGYGPAFLKKTLDSLAKKMNFGDVMIIKARKH